MKLALVISSLGSGGAERVLTTLANYWASEGHDVCLITLQSSSLEPFYKIDEQVSQIHLGNSVVSNGILDAFLNNVDRINSIRCAVVSTGAEVVVSFVDVNNIRVILAMLGSTIPVVVSERIDPGKHSIGPIWSFLRRALYPLASAIVVQSDRVAKKFNYVESRVKVIPNPVVCQENVLANNAHTKRRRIISVGRLHPQKGFDLLLLAAKEALEANVDWELVIWGEGSERNALISQRDELGLTNRVSFPGNTSDIWKELYSADIFVLSSRYEGFPNALCEAMASGLPVVSFDCESGPFEIITNDFDGLLVPDGDVVLLGEALRRLIEDESLRDHLGINALKIKDKYSLPEISRSWEHLLCPSEL